MDRKEQYLVERTLDRLRRGSFSERDVIALLILLRRHAQPRSAVREFGDFIAHREKDRGVLQEFLARVQRRLAGSEPSDIDPPRLPVFTATEVEHALNDVLAALNFASIDGELANRIVVSTISILQDVQVQTDFGSAVQGFAVGISTQHIGLLGHGTLPPRGHVFSFPLLVARNNGYEFSLTLPNAPVVDQFMTATGLVETCCEGGRFSIAQKTA